MVASVIGDLNHGLIINKLASLGLTEYKLLILDQVDSTNKYALLNSHNLVNKTIISTELQTAGYGRNGKTWLSRPGVDLNVSFIYRFKLTDEYSLLPLVIAVGIHRLFNELGLVTQIKWPNDILLKDTTKVAGVLVEAKIEEDMRVLVIGVGVDNLNPWDRNILFCCLVKHINAVINEYKTNSFKNLRQEWLDNCIHYQKQITLSQRGQIIAKGLHTDITLDGGIQIQDVTSKFMTYNGSQISLTFK